MSGAAQIARPANRFKAGTIQVRVMADEGAQGARLEPSPDGAFEAFERASHFRSLAVALLRASHDCVKLLDLDGCVAALNPAAETVLQLDDPLSLVGSAWREMWPEPDRERVQESVRSAAAGLTTTFEGFCPTAKGEPRWWQVTVSPVCDDAGFVRFVLVNSRDITAQREREREVKEALTRQRQAILSLATDFEASARKLRDAEARVVHDDKLRMFGRFVGSVVHDFNNVFAAVHGAARLLKRRLTDPVTLDIVGHLEGAAERGGALARQLLDFSRAEAEATEVFAPAELLTRDAHLLRHIVSAEATLVIETEPDGWPVLGSPQKFQSVVFNLVANARDAISADGRIVVSLENCGALHRPEGMDWADYVLLTVADNGCGMPEDVLKRAGEPFFTTKPAGKGSGLGLASAFELAALCRGRAFVESRAGAGARISVYMRRSAVEGETVGAPDAAVDPALHGGARILVVDDDPMVREHLAGVFRGLRYEVVEASAYEVAAATAQEGAPFDLVITDVNLIDGLGDRLVAELRKAQPGLPAIYVTGSSGLNIPRDETVLRKPVSETRLAVAVLEKLGRLAAAAPQLALRQVERISDRVRDPQMRRFLLEWRALAEAARRIPSVFDPGPWREEPPPLGYVVAIGQEETPTLRFARAGFEISARLGRELHDTEIGPQDEDMFGDIPRALRRRLDGSPGYDYARFALGDGEISTVERLLLPLSDETGRVGHIFGLVAFNERASHREAS
jgi:PAS domain S-box-containing protein